MKYLADAKAFIDTVPSSLLEAKVEKQRLSGDPYPLSIQISKEKQTTVYFPEDLPEVDREKYIAPLTELISMSELSGFEIKVTKRKPEADFWNLLLASSDAIAGAFYACDPDKPLGPMDNIPTVNRRGWDYMVWYGFAKAARINDHSDYYCIPRVTSILSADKAAWGGGKVFTDVDRLNTLLRSIAQAKAQHSIAPVKRFLKGSGYFLSKLLGKKPVPGIYTAEELDLLNYEWNRRRVKIEEAFNNLHHEFRDYTLGDTLTSQLQTIQVGVSAPAKQVEATANKRIPELLVTEGRGKAQRKVIAKGSSLPEKLLSINGGDSVRTIAKVMWSPTVCSDHTQSHFCDVVLRVAKERYLSKKDVFETYRELESSGTSLSKQQEAILTIEPIVNEAVEVYLEIIPDRSGSPAWDATFGVRK
jgi:hypothetical protein